MGTRDVAGAIIASTLTTCVIFLPVVFTRTISGALFQALALVVVFALACSLLVSFGRWCRRPPPGSFVPGARPAGFWADGTESDPLPGWRVGIPAACATP